MYQSPPPQRPSPSGNVWIVPTVSILGLIIYCVAWGNTFVGSCRDNLIRACFLPLILLNMVAYSLAGVGLIITAARKHQLTPWKRNVGYGVPIIMIAWLLVYIFFL